MTTNQILSHLRHHGSRSVAASSQRFFTHAIKSHGWRTADLERYAREVAPYFLDDQDKLYATCLALAREGSSEALGLACFLLERPKKRIPEHFPIFLRLLPFADDWSKVDCLCIRLIAPSFLVRPALATHAVRWSRSRNLWTRRAAAASLVFAARKRVLHKETFAVADCLVTDKEDMVQKGIGWLLREVGKASPEVAVPYLLRIRTKTSRLVLRTACESLPARDRKRILS